MLCIIDVTSSYIIFCGAAKLLCHSLHSGGVGTVTELSVEGKKGEVPLNHAISSCVATTSRDNYHCKSCHQDQD